MNQTDMNEIIKKEERDILERKINLYNLIGDRYRDFLHENDMKIKRLVHRLEVLENIKKISINCNTCVYMMPNRAECCKNRIQISESLEGIRCQDYKKT